MSGILGVSPNMKSGVWGKFPAGTVVQVVYSVITAGADHINESETSMGTLDITYKTNNPRVYAQVQGLWGFVSQATGVADGQYYTKIRNNTSSTNLCEQRSLFEHGDTSSKNDVADRSICGFQDVTATAATTHTFDFKAWSTNGTYTRFVLNRHSTSGDHGDTHFHLMEIAR